MASSPVGLTGTQSFENLSKTLKRYAPEIRKGYLRALREATAPAKTAIPESARRTLPRRGGLNEAVASSLKVTIRSSLSGPVANVRIVATEGPRRRVRSLDAGQVRHPLFGNREHWYPEAVQPGFFTRPCLSLRPEARRKIAAATNDVLRKIAG